MPPNAYVDLYKESTRNFRIDDRVDDDAVVRLTSAEPKSLGLTATLYPYQEVGVGWLRVELSTGSAACSRTRSAWERPWS